jgi:hypothetical protein
MGKQRYGTIEPITPGVNQLGFDDKYLDRVRLREDEARKRKAREDALKEHLSQYEDDPFSQALAAAEFESQQEEEGKARQQQEHDRIAGDYDDPFDKAFAVAEHFAKQQQAPEAKKAFADNERLQQLRIRPAT